mmetsp:Transcript_19509/g.28686  ORF Transcript_19509/g.28686 Transcript_19509/m.28686 type:complete len:126 (-) Transcript_19509:256-633(-)
MSKRRNSSSFSMAFYSVLSRLKRSQNEDCSLPKDPLSDLLDDDSTITFINTQRDPKNPYENAVINRERMRRTVCESIDQQEWESIKNKLKAANVHTNLGAAIVMNSIFLGDIHDHKRNDKRSSKY